MQDKELYRHILGLESPWCVAEVKFDTENQQINIHVAHPRGTKFRCPECDPECNEPLPCYSDSRRGVGVRLDGPREGGCGD